MRYFLSLLSTIFEDQDVDTISVNLMNIFSFNGCDKHIFISRWHNGSPGKKIRGYLGIIPKCQTSPHPLLRMLTIFYQFSLGQVGIFWAILGCFTAMVKITKGLGLRPPHVGKNSQIIMYFFRGLPLVVFRWLFWESFLEAKTRDGYFTQILLEWQHTTRQTNLSYCRKKFGRRWLGLEGSTGLRFHCSFVVLFLKLFRGGILTGDKMQTIHYSTTFSFHWICHENVVLIMYVGTGWKITTPAICQFPICASISQAIVDSSY